MTDTQKIPLVAVVGPTASGKTSLGIELAKKYDGEIISADSMQIYKHMDIATAKPTVDEMQGIPHHLIGFLPPDVPFSVAEYTALAKDKIEDVHSRGKLPIIVGGTGLYVSSLLNNIQFSQSSSDEALREELSDIADKKGADALLEMLAEFDPDSAKRLSEQKNVKRIIRAIEIYKTTGITMTESLESSKIADEPYKAVRIGLRAEDRQFLYDRINKRVDIMLKGGLLEETRKIMDLNLGKTAKMAIGYKELIPYFEGDISLDAAVEKLKMETRRYAKRQLTWFRRDEKISWIDIDKLSNCDIIRAACDIVEGSGIFD